MSNAEHEDERDERDEDEGPGFEIEAPWTIRRRFMGACIIFCMGVIAYVLHYDMRSSVADTAVTMSFVTITSTVGSYVFGAAWDDHSRRQSGRGRRRRGGGYPMYPGGRF